MPFGAFASTARPSSSAAATVSRSPSRTASASFPDWNRAAGVAPPRTAGPGEALPGRRRMWRRFEGRPRASRSSAGGRSSWRDTRLPSPQCPADPASSSRPSPGAPGSAPATGPLRARGQRGRRRSRRGETPVVGHQRVQPGKGKGGGQVEGVESPETPIPEVRGGALARVFPAARGQSGPAPAPLFRGLRRPRSSGGASAALPPARARSKPAPDAPPAPAGAPRIRARPPPV